MRSPNSEKSVGELQARISDAYGKFRDFIKSRGNDRLHKLWEAWDGRFRDILERTNHRPEVAISLVGGTGAGKSTLVNALIGARVLPVSNMRACTAAICEVAYTDGPYRARIEFVPRETWDKEVRQLQDELRDTQAALAEENNSDEPAQMSRAVRDKLWTVYRPSDDADPAHFDPFNLVDVPEIKQALDTGFVELSTDDLKDFRKQVARYLDSKERFWPIVKSVAICGNFAALRDGAKIIDLPGINDPNEAREEVTRKHLKSCRYVWLVFNIKRALTRDTISLMQSGDFFRQIVMDGRTDSLTFVGTASDDVDRETGIEEFRLDDDATTTEVVLARNHAVRKVIHDQLDDLATRLGEMAREQQATATKLAGRLKASRIFTVSAREYMRLEGLAQTNSAGFDKLDHTEIPALVSHMRDICANYGVAAHCATLQRQMQLLAEEIQREIKSQQAFLNSQVEMSQKGREEMRAAIHAARTFLEQNTGSAKRSLVQALDSDQAVLVERVSRSAERARSELESTYAVWNRLHWNSLKAACRRKGVHVGTRGRIDLPAELSKPILNGIAFAWSDFFGERLSQTLDKWTSQLLRHQEVYRDQLAKSFQRAPDLSAELIESVDGILKTTECVIQEMMAQAKAKMEERIQKEQRTLYESIPIRVQANMLEAFETAAKESGTGMKQRIVDILSRHANRVARVMFDDSRDAILGGVRSLNSWLSDEYDNMVEAVRRHAGYAAENLLTSGESKSQERIAFEQSVLQDLSAIIVRWNRDLT